jgi:hypothetical protein
LRSRFGSGKIGLCPIELTEGEIAIGALCPPSIASQFTCALAPLEKLANNIATALAVQCVMPPSDLDFVERALVVVRRERQRNDAKGHRRTQALKQE